MRRRKRPVGPVSVSRTMTPPRRAVMASQRLKSGRRADTEVRRTGDPPLTDELTEGSPRHIAHRQHTDRQWDLNLGDWEPYAWQGWCKRKLP